MSLFGPSQGRLLGIPAFIGIFVFAGIMGSKIKRGTWRGLGFSDRLIAPILVALLALCIIVAVASLITLVVSSGNAGTAEGNHPIFDHQDEYRLSRGAVVTRKRYLIVGTSMVITWHAMGICFALVPLFAVMCGWRYRYAQPDAPS